MTPNTLLRKSTRALSPSLLSRSSCSQQHWLILLTWMTVLALFVMGIWMRLHLLDVPFDRDSYDEGVYWQSLHSMTTGAALYQQIFYSQPPFFLISLYPFYTLFGQTIWSARLGIAIISLCGFLGAMLLGKALAGRWGMLLALLLLVINPLYLRESQTLQADAPSTALMLLAVGLAYQWWERPHGMIGYCLAALAAITLALSMLTKFLAAPALVPIIILALLYLLKARKSSISLFASIGPILLGCVAFIITIVLLLLPFSHAFSQLYQTVVTFHTHAKVLFLGTQSQNGLIIRPVLTSLLGASALYGTVIALLRRDWRMIPLLVWLIATLYLLWQQAPLFYHHVVALIPPLIALAVMGISPITSTKQHSDLLEHYLFDALPLKIIVTNTKRDFFKAVSKVILPSINIATVLIIILAFCQITSNIQSIRYFYHGSYMFAHSHTIQANMYIAQNLQRVTKQDQLVITDAQFIAAEAGRSTPASLVDTSSVRILTGDVTTQQLRLAASQPQVHAVLFFTDRLDRMPASFHNWVQQHFYLAYFYGRGKELWVKR